MKNIKHIGLILIYLLDNIFFSKSYYTLQADELKYWMMITTTNKQNSKAINIVLRQ